MTLYRHKYNSLYYRVIQGRVSYSYDTVVWWPSVFTERNLLYKPDIFVALQPPSITLENK